MSSEQVRTRCQALTKAGKPCKNYALAGSQYCRVHYPSAGVADQEAPERERRRELAARLDQLIRRVRARTPGYEPPPFSPRRLVALIEENLGKLPEAVQLDLLERVRGSINEEWFDLDTWKGVWYMVNYTLQYNSDMIKRHFTGEYETDEWGMDWELSDALRPLFSFLYKIYWRVETSGIENIPIEGRVLLVANHSGQLPWDATMVSTAVATEHPAQRMVRTLYDDWVSRVPFLSAWSARLGQALATVENGTRLLEQDEVVAVYPEGDKGVGKLFKDRYKLARFGDAGFVTMALNAQAPIIPVSVVGAEETYVSLANSRTMARVTGLPSFPISPTFPWLGLLGLVPLPSKWYIDFGQPIPMDDLQPEAASNLVLVSQFADSVRHTVQEMLLDRLGQRRSVFW
jgi:1-acyl-sn-glycerol-3-phosphate acyltransferase